MGTIQDEKMRLRKFIEEQNRLHAEYGFFFPIGTKILGKDENGLLEIKAYLELEGLGYISVDNIKNSNIKVDAEGNNINKKRRRRKWHMELIIELEKSYL